jgi:hypothetical protein
VLDGEGVKERALRGRRAHRADAQRERVGRGEGGGGEVTEPVARDGGDAAALVRGHEGVEGGAVHGPEGEQGLGGVAREEPAGHEGRVGGGVAAEERFGVAAQGREGAHEVGVGARGRLRGHGVARPCCSEKVEQSRGLVGLSRGLVQVGAPREGHGQRQGREPHLGLDGVALGLAEALQEGFAVRRQARGRVGAEHHLVGRGGVGGGRHGGVGGRLVGHHGGRLGRRGGRTGGATQQRHGQQGSVS